MVNTAKAKAKAMKGGSPGVSKYTKLGEGSYGCVVKPAIPCIGEKNMIIPPNSVSKIFYANDDYAKELQNNGIFKQLPNSEKYFILAIKSCQADIEADDLYKIGCEVPAFKTLESYPKQIILPEATMDLFEYMGKSPPTLTEWIKLLTNLMEAIKLLCRYGIVHFDIKPANIMYDTETKTLRIIDFGLSKKTDDVYTNEYRGQYYVYHPPEVCMWDNYTPDTFNEYVTRYKMVTTYSNDFKDMTVMEEKEFNRSRLSYAKPDSGKIDMFMLGMTCITIHREIDIKDSEKATLLPKYIDLIENMISFDYRKRWGVFSLLDTITEIAMKI